MGRRALGLAILVVAGIGSCADVAGISDFSDCPNGICSGPSTGSATDAPVGPPLTDSPPSDDQGVSPQPDVNTVTTGEADVDANPTDTTVPPTMDSTMPDVVGDERQPDAPQDITVPDRAVVQDVMPIPDVVPEAPPQPGPECWGADGGPSECTAGQTCCVNATTNMAHCVQGSSCSSPESPVSCVGASGNFPAPSLCGSKICCGTLALNGMGVAPVCTATQLTSSCQSTCNDLPPGSCAAANYTIRVCASKADCTSDGLNNTCCRFGGSPLYWCVGNTLGSAACLN